MAMTWLACAIGTIFLIVGVFYGGYLLFLKVASSLSRMSDGRGVKRYRPSVSMIIPVYNESKVIQKKIENIRKLSYPHHKLEVLFVDGGSSDDTPRLIRQHLGSENPSFRLISEKERQGYNRAIVAGIVNSSSDVVVLADAGSFHDSESLINVVDPLGDSRIGVVTGKAVMLNESEGVLPRLESEYRGFNDFVRFAESCVDSTPDMKGELLAAKRTICMKLAEEIEHLDRASFDVCLAFQARLEGLRAIFEPNARFYEYAPSTLRDRLRVQIRRASLLVGTFFSFRGMLLRRKYGVFGTVTLPAHWVMLVVLPWLVLGSLAMLIVDLAFDPILALTLLAISGAAMFSERIRALAISFTLSQVALVAGLLRLLLAKSPQIINTAASTRR